MKWAVMPFVRYAQFSGRSRRKEYWMFTLLNSLVLCAIGALMYATISPDNLPMHPTESGVGIAFIVWIMVVFVPSWAVQVRRFHDQDRSGWLALLALIPYIGGTIVLGFSLIEGTAGPNRYGPDPKANGSLLATDVVAF